MVLLANSETLEHLLEERHKHYVTLLECSRRQLNLLKEREGDEFPSLFSELQQEWNNSSAEIDRIQQIISSIDRQAVMASDKLQEIMQQCLDNMIILQQELAKYQEDLGGDVLAAKNQKSVMNAYYGMNRKEQIPLYFDEKK